MRTVIQRVKYAKVSVDGKILGEIDKGLLVLLGVTHEDTIKEVKWLANKTKNLRKNELVLGKCKGKSFNHFTIYSLWKFYKRK